MEIYAEPNKKQLFYLEHMTGNFPLPVGVTLTSKNSRGGCLFECEDVLAKEQLIDLLDSIGVSWQSND